MNFSFSFPYKINPVYKKPVAYFCMEYAIHQPLKTYAGGLGFLAGSHMRSAYELKQNVIGIGILWKYGYYDQVRKSDQGMDILFQEKVYGFLIKTDIRFTINVSGNDVIVAVWYLPPGVFHTAPLFFLSTDIEENDYLSRTISHSLYPSNPETKIATAILLGVGGARLLEILEWEPDIYHLNETHALPLAFYLYQKFKNTNEVKKRLVFTCHTPEPPGSQLSNIFLLDKMRYFCNLSIPEVKNITNTYGDQFDHTAAAFRLAGIANGVSKLHGQTLQHSWKQFDNICPVISITNAQSFSYWSDDSLYKAVWNNNDEAFKIRKRHCKQLLFEEVADQNGEMYNPDILTIVFAKRFAGYKRADLLLRNMDRFQQLVSNKQRPVQIIWAGKPFPVDYAAIGIFDKIVNICKSYSNCSILVGYELKLSKLLKRGADVWLNVPRITREASGTSGISAAMNGAVNVAIPDGWFPEFANDKVNSFVIPAPDSTLPDHRQDEADCNNLYDVLEKEVIPMYYDSPSKWLSVVKNSMCDITPYFDSNRLAQEYYEKLYDRVTITPAITKEPATG